ncbi:MAG: hypothetical protein PHQ23_05740 [Candidatus Wallbacteria bacterium]|nr:hypothetical protein [Candidatus Wallbacteria bacterium]
MPDKDSRKLDFDDLIVEDSKRSLPPMERLKLKGKDKTEKLKELANAIRYLMNIEKE